jgi:16S rRNA (guanine(1405)-N(7))-methyltransferase
MSDVLDELVREIHASAKYRAMCEEIIRTIGEQELSKRSKPKDAIEATRNRLHQIGGAFLDGKPNYGAWLKQLDQVDAAERRSLIRKWLQQHASTRERLPILDMFYATLFAQLPPIHSVLDVACGLNPLTRDWMPLEPDAHYVACDIYSDMMDFLHAFFESSGLRGDAIACDVTRSLPTQFFDLALLFKCLPCLEQIDKNASTRLLDRIDARHLIVTYPVSSLGGRDKNMRANYEQHFAQLVHERGWRVQRFEFESELAFLVSK